MGALPHIPYCKSVTISPDERSGGTSGGINSAKLSLDLWMTYYLQILLSSTPDLQDSKVPTSPTPRYQYIRILRCICRSLFRYPCCQDIGDSQTQVDCTVGSPGGGRLQLPTKKGSQRGEAFLNPIPTDGSPGSSGYVHIK